MDKLVPPKVGTPCAPGTGWFIVSTFGKFTVSAVELISKNFAKQPLSALSADRQAKSGLNKRISKKTCFKFSNGDSYFESCLVADVNVQVKSVRVVFFDQPTGCVNNPPE